MRSGGACGGAGEFRERRGAGHSRMQDARAVDEGEIDVGRPEDQTAIMQGDGMQKVLYVTVNVQELSPRLKNLLL